MNPNDVDDGKGKGEGGVGDRPVVIEKYLKHGFSCLPERGFGFVARAMTGPVSAPPKAQWGAL